MLRLIFFIILATLGWRDCVWSQEKPATNRNQVVFASQFVPPVEYREWYHQAERCVGKRGNFSKIIWTVTRKPWNYDSLGRALTYGLFAPSTDGIHGVILLNATDWENKWYVMHEEIHDILWRNGWVTPGLVAGVHDSVNIRNQHPLPYYERCTKTYIEDLRKKWAADQSPYRTAYKP